MNTATVLLEVVDRNTRLGLLPMEERKVEVHCSGENGPFLVDRAKRQYLAEIETKIKFEPTTRRRLGQCDWCIDGVHIS